MKYQFARTSVVGLLCSVTFGCDVGQITLAGFGSGCGGSNSAACQEISLRPSGSLVLLLGDTAGLSASNGAGDTDMTWQSTLPAVASVGNPVFEAGWLFSFGSSHVAVTGVTAGSATITARRGKYSAAASIDVIPPSALRAFIPTRQHCPDTPAGLCDPILPSGAPDTLHVGDTISVGGNLTDVAFRPVIATIRWTSSNIAVAEPTLAVGLVKKIQVVAAKSVGKAIVTGSVGGLTGLFELNVVK